MHYKKNAERVPYAYGNVVLAKALTVLHAIGSEPGTVGKD